MTLKTCLILCLLLSGACQAQRQPPENPFPEGKHILFLDSIEAADRVSRDNREGFFEKINGLDRAIQMKSAASPSLEAYRDFLRRDALSFSADEIAFLHQEMHAVYGLCANVSPNLLPDTLRLIKTRGAYYGPSVYYTREDCIVIPEDVLVSKKGMQEVLLHELFHIISRYNPSLRHSLYTLIGFQALEAPVNLPPILQERVLLNPDGFDQRWAIRLDTTLAIPLIFSRFRSYKPSQGPFFTHIDFQLFALEEEAGQYRALVSPDGSSTLNADFFVYYLQRVKDNTAYIIHPDEILADNFIWAIRGDEDNWTQFSEEGKGLLREMQVILQNCSN